MISSRSDLIDVSREHRVDQPKPLKLNQKDGAHRTEGHRGKKNIDLELTRGQQTCRGHRQET